MAINISMSIGKGITSSNTIKPKATLKSLWAERDELTATIKSLREDKDELTNSYIRKEIEIRKLTEKYILALEAKNLALEENNSFLKQLRVSEARNEELTRTLAAVTIPPVIPIPVVATIPEVVVPVVVTNPEVATIPEVVVPVVVPVVAPSPTSTWSDNSVYTQGFKLLPEVYTPENKALESTYKSSLRNQIESTCKKRIIDKIMAGNPTLTYEEADAIRLQVNVPIQKANRARLSTYPAIIALTKK